MKSEKVNSINEGSKSTKIISVGETGRERFIETLNRIKKMKNGGNINGEQLLMFLIDKLGLDWEKELIGKSLTPKQVQDLYKQRYFEQFNTTSEEEFIAFVWSDKIQKFKKDNKDVLDLN